jgi:hypothetical protein
VSLARIGLGCALTLVSCATIAASPNAPFTDVLGVGCLMKQTRIVKAIEPFPDGTWMMYVIVKRPNSKGTDRTQITRDLIEKRHLKPGMRICWLKSYAE